MVKKIKETKQLLKNRGVIYSVACVLLMIDQLVKLLIRSNIPLLDEIPIIPNFFSLYHIENTGAAFSIFSGATVVLIVFSVLVLVFLNLYVITDEIMNSWKKFGLGIVIGGIIGNLVDRILFGAVVDYLSFYFLGYGFPVFNIADIGITIGFLILVVDMVRSEVYEYRSRSCRK